MENKSVDANDGIWPDTHLFRDYQRLKAEAPSAILLIEMAGFLEVYGEDAVPVATILDIALSQRGLFLDGTPIPMCAIPADSRFTSSTGGDVEFIGSTGPYLKALVKAGYAVAIAVCQPTMPVTRKIEWTIWPDVGWARDAPRRRIN